MGLDIQKAGIWKRIAAWMLDAVLFMVLAIGFIALMSGILNYGGHLETLNGYYEKYEKEYGIDFSITQEEYDKLSEEELNAYKDNYTKAFDALNNDAVAMKEYNLVVSLSLVIVTISLLLTYLALEFLIPLIFGNGQTVGKKVFALGVIRVDCVKVTTLQLLVRTLLGKFTVETMIPVYIILMLLFGTTGLFGLAFMGILGLVQIVMVLATRNHYAIHDYFAGTVVVDIQSQKVFDTAQDLIEYKKKLHAEQAARQEY